MDLERIYHKLIVSCQALEDEPLYSSFIMGRLAIAAKQGGAGGIRANSVADIKEIKRHVDLPLIGIIKKNYSDSDIYITATMKETKALVEQTQAEIIAMDATDRKRPSNENIADLISFVHEHGRLAMADISNLSEGILAEKLGFDLVSTTLSGYTAYTPKRDEPDFDLVKELTARTKLPVIMEGHTTSPKQVIHAFELGAYAVVVGGAITRPQQITERYTKEILNFKNRN
ncbi:N-acetylmannosamine-6-phosphate 2-epimerase [Pediococcus siamensis]|uniref:N-acetylmannosamine-6-phosphate 2-epimerase n=1 Tax=Pediococcus siamensis TaxID=381829 RepID=UPI00399F62AC